MASFDFATVPERRGTDSQKWQKYAGRDILPLWVADMDFASPPAIVEALRRRTDHGLFGYARPVNSTVDAVTAAMESRYGWRIDPAWLVWLPGLVCGLNVAIEAYSEPGDGILSLTPIYPPFLSAPPFRGRVAQPVPLLLRGGSWQIDWEGLERAVTPRSRMFLFCHPHNPVARVWRREELERLAEFCARHRLVLCSDEIHCDLVLDPSRRHVPTALAHPGPVVTMMAPSKTYNIPGLGTSFAVISDPGLRQRLLRAARGIVAEVNALGYAACEAAYRDCEPWRLELLAALRGNRDFLADFLAREAPAVRLEAPIEATYLAWLNVETLRLPDPVAHFERHGLGLSNGADFGAAPGTHVRLNFGCPRATLAEALRRLKAGAEDRAR
ncbi:MAG TPA: PatB family C-S lyase [Opitutaceae bacterium]|nr:PatB family C-S lyase [Opitutaceae bacterium]